MKAFIFAAGNGTRFDGLDKPFLEIDEMTIVERLITQLVSNGISRHDIIIGISNPEYEAILGEDYQFVYVKDPEDYMIKTMLSAREYLEKESTFLNFCGDEVYSNSVIDDAVKSKGLTIVKTTNKKHSTTCTVSFPGDCFKYIEDWIENRDQLSLRLIQENYNCNVLNSRDYIAVNVNDRESYDYAKEIFE